MRFRRFFRLGMAFLFWGVSSYAQTGDIEAEVKSLLREIHVNEQVIQRWRRLPPAEVIQVLNRLERTTESAYQKKRIQRIRGFISRTPDPRSDKRKRDLESQRAAVREERQDKKNKNLREPEGVYKIKKEYNH